MAGKAWHYVHMVLLVLQGDNGTFKAVEPVHRLPPPATRWEPKHSMHAVSEQDGGMEQGSAMSLSEPTSNGDGADGTAVPEVGTSQQSQQEQPDASMQEARSKSPVNRASAGL